MLVTLDWVLICDLVALLSGIILGVMLMASHHHMRLEMDEES